MDTIKVNNKRNVKMIAHRGLSGLETENTNAAFVAAGNRTYYGIETDVYKTQDGHYVISHFDNTEYISRGAFNINLINSDYDATNKIVLPDIDGSMERNDIRIPFLHEYIKICKKYEKKCVLEIKSLMSKEDMSGLFDVINEYDYLHNVIFISFWLENCITVRELLPEQPIQWLLATEVTEEIKQTLYQYHFELDIEYPWLSKELIDELHSHNVLVNCWTTDSPKRAEILIEMGVDFITTNLLE